MIKFKPGDAVLCTRSGFNGNNSIGKIIAMCSDGHYIVETSNGFLVDAKEECLTMYKIHYSKYYKNNPGNLSYLIKRVVFSDMATIVIWGDGTKTIVRKQDDDVYDPEKAIAMCFMKKMCQKNKWSMNDIFETWINKDLTVGTCIGIDLSPKN